MKAKPQPRQLALVPRPETKADRQVEIVRLNLERMARGRDELISRAARRLLRLIAEVE